MEIDTFRDGFVEEGRRGDGGGGAVKEMKMKNERWGIGRKDEHF